MDHVYGDGPCRPGFVCEHGCESYREERIRDRMLLCSNDSIELMSYNGKPICSRCTNPVEATDGDLRHTDRATSPR
jgi:hypothetical protein